MAEKLTSVTPVSDAKIKQYAAQAAATKAKVDKANESHRSGYKLAKEAGLDIDALKLAVKLKRKEPTALAEFLRNFDHYRQALGLDDQGDLLEDAA